MTLAAAAAASDAHLFSFSARFFKVLIVYNLIFRSFSTKWDMQYEPLSVVIITAWPVKTRALGFYC